MQDNESSRFIRNYYILRFRQVNRWLLVSLLINVVCMLVIAYMVFSFPKPNFYATNPSGHIQQMKPYLTEKVARNHSL